MSSSFPLFLSLFLPSNAWVLPVKRCQIITSDTETSLVLSDLSPDDNGRVIVCSAENVVGKNEAALQLDIHCKPCSVAVVDHSSVDANHLPRRPNLP